MKSSGTYAFPLFVVFLFSHKWMTSFSMPFANVLSHP
ncbi:hypothetical protein FF1_023461 [Malus domestica]